MQKQKSIFNHNYQSSSIIPNFNNSEYVFIESIEECCDIVEDIILKECIIAVDCEGVCLSKEGKLTLIQVLLS